MKDLITVHHEMAHIQYFLRYSHLPREFRDGANPGMKRTKLTFGSVNKTGKIDMPQRLGY